MTERLTGGRMDFAHVFRGLSHGCLAPGAEQSIMVAKEPFTWQTGSRVQYQEGQGREGTDTLPSDPLPPTLQEVHYLPIVCSSFASISGLNH
jgi:hypothetical protein